MVATPRCGHGRHPADSAADAARLYRIAIERGEAGRNYHAVDEQGVPLRELAETIGRGVGVPARSISTGAAASYFGPLLPFATMDCPTSSAETRTTLGWTPREVGLLEQTARALR